MAKWVGGSSRPCRNRVCEVASDSECGVCREQQSRRVEVTALLRIRKITLGVGDVFASFLRWWFDGRGNRDVLASDLVKVR